MKYKQIDHMASIATIYDNIKIITKKIRMHHIYKQVRQKNKFFAFLPHFFSS